MQTPEEALPPLRRALQLSPSDRIGNDLTLCALTTPRHEEELIALLEQQVKTRNAPILRLMLIKAHQKANQSDAAEREARALVRERPDDLQANIFLAALMMMRSDAETNLQESGERQVSGTGAERHRAQRVAVCRNAEGDLPGAHGQRRRSP